MTTISSNYNVASFNTYSARGGDDALDGIGELADASDIIGFQETGDPGKHLDAGARVAGEMIEQGLNGYMGPPNGNPIFWQRDRFDLLHAETSTRNDFGAAGETRATNLVVLRDTETGTALLVSNLHAETGNGNGERTRQFDDLETRADALAGQFDIAARIDIGDHNQSLPDELYGDAAPDTVVGGGNHKTEPNQNLGTGGIDHIASKGLGDHATRDLGSEVRSPPDNGDFYRHQMLVSTIGVTAETLGNALNALAPVHGDNGKGAVAYQDHNYGGKAWAFGFGTPESFGTGDGSKGVKHSDINDRISSVRVSDDAALTLRQDADGGGRSLRVDESLGNVGKDMNDRASSFAFHY